MLSGAFAFGDEKVQTKLSSVLSGPDGFDSESLVKGLLLWWLIG